MMNDDVLERAAKAACAAWWSRGQSDWESDARCGSDANWRDVVRAVAACGGDDGAARAAACRVWYYGYGDYERESADDKRDWGAVVRAVRAALSAAPSTVVVRVDDAALLERAVEAAQVHVRGGGSRVDGLLAALEVLRVVG